jgi:hypothetical protein
VRWPGLDGNGIRITGYLYHYLLVTFDGQEGLAHGALVAPGMVEDPSPEAAGG